jgi:hypothetical protein
MGRGKRVDRMGWAMTPLRLGFGALAIALTGTLLAPAVSSGAQTTLQARISPSQVTPDGAPLLESVDVCLRGASSPQINVVVTAPSGEVVIDQWHLVGTTEPGVIVDSDGSWSVELQLRDDDGQPTGDPFPSLGTYTVHVDCVTTYTPQVRIPYNELSFEVVETTTTTSTTEVAPPDTPGGTTTAQARPAVPVQGQPEFVG